jgi:branched-chain amino acid aminotransferase
MPADLEGADEVFITSTTRDLLLVRQVEEQKVGRSDRARKALAEGFAEFVRNYVAAHKEVAA